MQSTLSAILLLVACRLSKQHDLDFDCDGKDKDVQCWSTISQSDCPEGEFLTSDGSLSGCCPGCVGGARLGEDCSDMRMCAPGLKCQGEAITGVCVLDKSTCSYTYHLQHLQSLPTCEIDGSFAAVQCKGDRVSGRCFCYAANGERIHGWAWWRQAADMTCACSRLKHKLHLEGHDSNTLHCDRMGNFERLQCTSGMCWCAEPRSGEMANGTRAVPEAMWTFLPCYDENEMGPQYLRQCESASNAQKQLKLAYFRHGTTNVEFNDVNCDYSGAYGKYQIVNGIANCIWHDSSKLGSHQVASNMAAKMNCNCARDQKIYTEAGLSHRLSCSSNGNYDSIQDVNGKVFCVDRDGFAVTEAKEMDILPDCSEFIYYEAK